MSSSNYLWISGSIPAASGSITFNNYNCSSFAISGIFSALNNISLYKDKAMTKAIEDVTEIEIGGTYYVYNNYVLWSAEDIFIANILIDNEKEIVFEVLDNAENSRQIAFSFKDKRYYWK